MDYWEVRIKCLDLALQKSGINIYTAGASGIEVGGAGATNLEKTVNFYYQVVVGKGPQPPTTGARSGTPEAAPTGAAATPGPTGAGKPGSSMEPSPNKKATKKGPPPVPSAADSTSSSGTPADAAA